VNSPRTYHGAQHEAGSRIDYQRYDISLSMLAADNIHSDSDTERDDLEPRSTDKPSAKDKSDIKFGGRNQSERGKSVRSRRKSKRLVVKANHHERTVVQGNQSPGLSGMEMDVSHDEEYGELVVSTGGLRRSGRTKRTRMNSLMEETGFERAKRARTRRQSKAA
jgi:hypothetical protein